jgi:competence protein ComEC
MNRPLAWVAVAWTAGTFAAGQGWLAGLLAPLAIFLCGMLLAIAAPHKPPIRPWTITLCFFAIGALLWNVRHAGSPGDAISRLVDATPNSKCVMTGRVQRTDLYVENAASLRFVLDVDKIIIAGHTHNVPGRVQVRCREPKMPVFVGQRVRVEGVATNELGAVNPGIYDAEDHLHAEKTYTQLTVRTPETVRILMDAPWWSIRYEASRLRVAEAEWFREIAPPQLLPFIYAVWLGDRNHLSRDTYATFRFSGIAHVLAVSGVHVGIIFASTMFGLRMFMRNGRYRALVAMMTVVLFALVAGASITSLRAALMVCIYLVADLFDREHDAATALSIAAILFLGYNPDSLYHIGFQLSYASVASILIFSKPIEGLLGALPTIARQSIAVSLAVQILVVPLAAHYFHVLPLCGPLINLVAVPLLTVVLWLCFLAALTAVLSLSIATVFAHAMLPAVSAIQTVALWGASVQHFLPAITSPTMGAAVAYVLVVLVAVGIRTGTRRGRWLHVGAVAGLLIGVFLCWQDWWPEPSVTFLDVRHGDATVIRSPEGRVTVVDAGDRNEYGDYGERVVAPYLWAHGISRIDYLFLTHADRDHMGGALFLLDEMPVGEVVLGPVAGDSAMERDVLDRCAKRAVAVRRVDAGDVFELGGARLHVLHPPREWPGNHDDNDLSVVLRLDWNNLRVLLPGDIEVEAEALVAAADCRADVLKVPHHGSRTSSSSAFIDAIAPRFAVVSTGGRIGREAVSPQVLDRYEQRNIKVLRTDERGAVILYLDDDEPRLVGTKYARPKPERTRVSYGDNDER